MLTQAARRGKGVGVYVARTLASAKSKVGSLKSEVRRLSPGQPECRTFIA